MPGDGDDRYVRRSALPWAIGSLVCSYASGFMQYLYGYYHWQVVFAFPPWKPPRTCFTDLCSQSSASSRFTRSCLPWVLPSLQSSA